MDNLPYASLLSIKYYAKTFVDKINMVTKFHWIIRSSLVTKCDDDMFLNLTYIICAAHLIRRHIGVESCIEHAIPIHLWRNGVIHPHSWIFIQPIHNRSAIVREHYMTSKSPARRATNGLSQGTDFDFLGKQQIDCVCKRIPTPAIYWCFLTQKFWETRIRFRHMTSLGQVCSELNLSLMRFIFVIRKYELSLYLR